MPWNSTHWRCSRRNRAYNGRVGDSAPMGAQEPVEQTLPLAISLPALKEAVERRRENMVSGKPGAGLAVLWPPSLWGSTERVFSSEIPLPPPTPIFLCLGCRHKISSLGGLNNRNLYFHSSRGCQAQIGVPARFGSGESSLSGLQTATLLLCPHMAERVSQLSDVSS